MLSQELQSAIAKVNATIATIEVETEVKKGVKKVAKVSVVLGKNLSFARIVNNRLLHQLVQHDAVIEQVIKDAIQETISSTTQHTATVHVVEVNKLTGFQWFQIWLGRICAAFLFAVIIFLVIKKYLNL
jgi:hypothetical protein